MQYFDWAVMLARPGGRIFVDDMVRQLIEDDDNVCGKALLEYMEADDRVEVAMMPIGSTQAVNHSGIVDGFVIAIKK